jgi:putative thioredoxin
MVIDVNEATFESAVLAASAQKAVVVDFWAPWCGPCRMLGPVLERLAEEAQGAWVLAKLNTDENPNLAMSYGIQGIPAVKAFRDGVVVDEFIGALPEPQVRAWLKPLLPSPAAELARRAAESEVAGDLDAAEADYLAALALDERYAGARLGLGRLQLAREDWDAGLATLQLVPRDQPEFLEAERLTGQARFRRDANVSGGEMAARRRLAADPSDSRAQLDLSNALAAKGDYRAALEGLLRLVEQQPEPERAEAREAMLAIFAALGDDHDLTREYRPLLAAALW